MWQFFKGIYALIRGTISTLGVVGVGLQKVGKGLEEASSEFHKEVEIFADSARIERTKRLAILNKELFDIEQKSKEK